MRQVLVSHPHAAAFANGAALGLSREGRLARYVVGLGAAEGTLSARLLSRAARRSLRLGNRVLPELPAGRVASLAPVELAARAGASIARATGLTQRGAYEAMFFLHDAAVAALAWPDDTDAVYAYEDAALWTFQRAARAGLARIWDLPLPHHARLEQMWREELRRWPDAMGRAPTLEPEFKKRRKDAELALADVVTVASTFTQRSLESVGFRGPVVMTPYGFPVEQFPARTAAPDGSFRVVAVGTQDLRKGTPYLLEAWRRAGLRDARLRLVGPMALTRRFLQPYRGLFEHVPHLPRTQLGEEYRAADLLVLPTLGDGFGLVLQEAMCCGVPVLTTTASGGPEVVTHGVEGFVVAPRDIDALVEHLRLAAANRDRLQQMGRAARARAERWTWREAGAALVERLDAALRRA